MYDSEKDFAKFVAGIAASVVGVIVLLFFVFGSWTIIDAGERGVVLRMGNVSRVIDPGFHFKLPFIEGVRTFTVRTETIERTAGSASKDLQSVSTTIVLNYSLVPENVGSIYTEIGTDYLAKVVDPAIQDVVKAATAQFNAEELITRRPEVKDVIESLLKARLANYHIIVQNANIVDFQFSAQFDEAVEAKVTAEQLALKAEQDLARVEFEAQQRIEQAKGEAEAIRIQAQAITQQGGKDYVNLQWIEAWKSGGAQVPQMMMGDGTNFLYNLNR